MFVINGLFFKCIYIIYFILCYLNCFGKIFLVFGIIYICLLMFIYFDIL